VSHSCACIGSPCLRHCVHGAPIGGGQAAVASAGPLAAAARRGSGACVEALLAHGAAVLAAQPATAVSGVSSHDKIQRQ
jgi:hypothetical protein